MMIALFFDCTMTQKAIYRIRKPWVTTTAKKVKRYIGFVSPRSLLLKKSKAIYRILRPEITTTAE